MSRFIDIANEYAEEFSSSEEKACLYVRQACQRHLDDLAKSKRKSAQIEFSGEKIQSICKYAQNMPHIAGEWANRGETIKLEPWQVFIYGSVFGWVRLDGLRRYRYAYCEIPRKNSKSTMLAIAGNYMVTEDGEHGAHVLCSATTEEQAHYVFKPAWEMAFRMPRFREWYGVKLGGTPENPGPIFVPKTGSYFKPIIGLPKDGASPHLAIVDEYHEHKSDGVYQTLVTGTKARSQPLVWVITTAGSNLGGPCYALRNDATQVLAGRVTDEETFSIIYTIDEDDNWASEAALKKANPNFGVSVNAESLMADMRRAVNSARLQNDFKTKHLNMWVGAKASWMNMEKWSDCGDSSLREENFIGEPCWMGVDLSQRNDFTSVVKLFKRDNEYYIFGRHYLPEAKVQDPINRHYQGWHYENHLIQIPGDVIDYNVVADDILSDQEKFDVVALGYDPMYATQFALGLLEKGVNAIEVKQIPSQLTEAMEDVVGEVEAGRFNHDDNPVMNWMMGNVVVKSHSRYGIKPDKESVDNKIDGPSAAITAMVMEHTQETVTKFIPEGFLVNF